MYAVHHLFSEQHFGKKVQINNTEYYLIINKDSDSWMAFNTATQDVEQITLSEATQCSRSDELPTLVGMLSDALLKLQGQRNDLSHFIERTSNKLTEIRQYDIDRHQQGEICRDGLDQFLEHFGMEPETAEQTKNASWSCLDRPGTGLHNEQRNARALQKHPAYLQGDNQTPRNIRRISHPSPFSRNLAQFTGNSSRNGVSNPWPLANINYARHLHACSA